MSTLEVCPEELVQEKIYFQWPSRTKMKRIYQRLFKEFDYDHKLLRCLDLWDKKIEVLRSAIALDKVDMACAEAGKATPKGK